jgi:hypothetical protein
VIVVIKIKLKKELPSASGIDHIIVLAKHGFLTLVVGQ